MAREHDAGDPTVILRSLPTQPIHHLEAILVAHIGVGQKDIETLTLKRRARALDGRNLGYVAKTEREADDGQHVQRIAIIVH